MRFLWFLFTRRKKKDRKPVSVLDSIVNDKDWYRPKEKRAKHERTRP